MTNTVNNEVADGDDDETITEENDTDLKRRRVNDISDYGLYQCLLFFLTQLGYLAVSPSMLSTTFFEPSEVYCNELIKRSKDSVYGDKNLTSFNIAEDTLSVNNEFHSLLMDWHQHCRASSWKIWMSSAVMIGAVVGAFIAGFIADRLGRKPAVVASMLMICIGNALLVLFGAFNEYMALLLFFFIGLACGGYMVTNMVLLIEILHNSTTRLLVVSLNGWPLGMVGTALIAYTFQHWRFYHLCISIFALIFFIIIQYFVFESIPWLVQSGRGQRAFLIQENLYKINTSLTRDKPSNNNLNGSSGDMQTVEMAINSKNASTVPLVSFLLDDNDDDLMSNNHRAYTYLDLFRHRSLCIRMITLLFCFGSSSIISFGLYFSVEILPGSRYSNIAIMGLGKLVLGFLPFILSNVMGRRPIMLISVGMAFFACWLLIIGWFIFDLSKHWIITLLGLFITGIIDPNWKIIHLLSMELFPTPVRNMARALCNVVARLGSLSGPWVLFLRSHNELLPFWLFGVLLTIQWIVSFCFLPETSGQPLPERMPSKNVAAHCHSSHSPVLQRRTFPKRTLSQQSTHSIRSRAYSVDVPIM